MAIFSNRFSPGRNPLAFSPGEARHLISIQAPVYAAGSAGMSISPSAWADVRDTTAAIYTAGGRETSQASQIVSSVSHVVKVRWTPTAILANYRVVFRSRSFTVQYVENVMERNRVLLLYCLVVDQATVVSVAPSSAVAHGIISEVPSGAIDGVNRIFMVSQLPVQLILHVDDVFADPTNDPPDYTLNGRQITFAAAPEAGANIHADGLY